MRQTTSEIFAAQGVPENVWRPIMQTESKGDPNAYFKTGLEESVGLFQLNRQGGLGAGHSLENLKNPEVNASIAAGAMSPAYVRGLSQGLTGFSLTQYVAYNSGWPTQAGAKALAYDPVVQAYNPKLLEAYTQMSGGTVETSAGSVALPPAVGISSQLQSLQGTAQASGGGWAAEAQGIGLMTLLAVLGLILLFLGLKMIGGGSSNTPVIIKEALGE